MRRKGASVDPGLGYGSVPIRRRGALARRHPSRRVRPAARSPDAFERLVEEALDKLPAEIRRLLERVAIVIEEEPRGGTDAGDWLYGLYEGTPITAWASDEVPFPNKITLYRVPLEADFPDPDQLADEVRRTVIHELAHHAGFDDARLAELGYE
jgi:predicted Zn-dependent protease with MMP-like domain